MDRFPRQSRAVSLLAVLTGLALTLPLLAADARARELAVNTCLLSGVVAVASITIGAPLAFLLARTDAYGRRVTERLLATLLFMPWYLQAAAWLAGFGMQGVFTGISGLGPLVDGWRGAILLHVIVAIPWVVLLVGLGLSWVEPELEEDALLDGTPAQVFRSVTLPRAGESIAVAAVWVAVITAGEMTITDLFQVRTYAEQLYVEFALGDTLGAAPWKLWPSIAACAWVVGGALWLTGRLIPLERHPTPRRAYVFALGRWRAPASAVMLGAIGLLAGLPLGGLVAKAGMIVTRHGQSLVRHWSWEQFTSMVGSSSLRFSRELGWSLAIGLSAATAALAIALPLAWNARQGGWRAAPAWLAVAMAMALPGPLIGLGLMGLFNRPEWPWLVDLYDHSIVVVGLAQSIRALPLCVLVLWSGFRSIPPEILDSARLDGASTFARFFRIVLPQRWRAVTLAWLVALAIAWGELPASILVAPPGVITLPIQIFNLIHYGVDDRVAGVSLDVAAGVFLLASLISLLARRGNYRGENTPWPARLPR